MHGKQAFDDYIAGLFDGEGSIHFKRGIEKTQRQRLSHIMAILCNVGKYGCWNIDQETKIKHTSHVVNWPWAHTKLPKGHGTLYEHL